MKNLLFVFCCLSAFPALFAQKPDTLQPSYLLPEFILTEARFTGTGYSFWKADTLPVSAPVALSDRLLWENVLDVRANAPGTLTTLSVRGSGSTRTPVFWNGLNLQSPMNGVIDASLLPLWPDDLLEIRYGGQSAAQSSGAMGGTVALVQGEQTLGTGFSGFTNGGAGSFGRYEGSGSTSFSNQKFASKIRAAWQQADNDFTFKKQGLDGQFYPTQQLNNFVRKTDLQQFNLLKINAQNTLKTAFWHQNAIRELPPTTTEASRKTWQIDRSNRALASWEHTAGPRILWTTRAAWMEDFLAFHLSGDTDTSRSRQMLLSTERSSTFGKQFAWRLGGTALRQWAQVDGYQDSIRWFGQTRLAAHGMGEWHRGDHRFSALFRKEWAEAQAAPFTWSFGGQVGLGRIGQARFHFSRNFNLPTLNDRYWKNLGRLELRPEKGYSTDLAWTLKRKQFSTEIRAFQMILDNWILWQPDSSGLFRPGNLKKVWSRGLESALKWQVSKGDWETQLSGNLQISKTTNVEVYGGSESALGKQLAYTPRVSGAISLRVSKGILAAAYLQQFTGIRYDNSGGRVSPFQVGNLLFSAALWKRRITLDLRLENLWNVQYEIIRYRPMPGRSWRLGIGYKW